MNQYVSNQFYSLTLCEQFAFIFTNMLKRLEQSERLYEEKKYEEASRLVNENITKTGALANYMIDFFCERHQDEFAQVWSQYLMTLMNDYTLLSIRHDPELKRSITERLTNTIQMWRKTGKDFQENLSPIYPTSTPVDRNVSVDA